MANNGGRQGNAGAGANGANMNEHVEFTVKVRDHELNLIRMIVTVLLF
jgi:hypothetical protein